MSKQPNILICDDDALFHQGVQFASKGKFNCTSAYNSAEALELIRRNPFDIVLLDVEMRTPEEGLESIAKIKAIDSELAILMTSGRTDLATVRRALMNGASDFLSKDFDLDEFVATVEKTYRRLMLERNQKLYQFETANHQKQFTMVGNSPATLAVKRLIAKYRQSPLSVLITGETGTGKEVVARQLRSQAADGSWLPFVAIDSSTIQSTTAESQLFGHERGAFTGADKANKGLFEEANGGDVYFDEISNMPLSIQTKLLRAIQEKEIVRLGSTRPIQLEFRVISATNVDLDKMVEEGRFKDDLLQRLNVLPISLPPLRERREDIPELVAELTRRHAPQRSDIQYTASTMECLKAYGWPGNIRELSNVIGFVLTMTEAEEIDLSDLPPKLLKSQSAAASRPKIESAGNFYDQVANFERALLSEALAKAQGNVKKVSETLQMDRSHLYTKLKQLGLSK